MKSERRQIPTLISRPITAAAAAIVRVAYFLTKRWMPSSHGFRLAPCSEGGIKKLTDALALVNERSPQHLTALRRSVDVIMVGRREPWIEYYPSMRMLYWEAEWPVELVATGLVFAAAWVCEPPELRATDSGSEASQVRSRCRSKAVAFAHDLDVEPQWLNYAEQLFSGTDAAV
jgi:hypothetical protein